MVFCFPSEPNIPEKPELKQSGTSFVDHFYYLCFMCVCYAVLSVPCSLVVTCWTRADLLALLYVIFSCVYVTFPYVVLGQVWYLIVSIPDTVKTLYMDILYNSKFLIVNFAQMYMLSLKLNSLLQKFSLTSNYLGTVLF